MASPRTPWKPTACHLCGVAFTPRSMTIAVPFEGSMWHYVCGGCWLGRCKGGCGVVRCRRNGEICTKE